MTRRLIALGIAALMMGALLSGPQETASGDGGFNISILSSNPDMVSDGDALVRVDVPAEVLLSRIIVERNGVDVTSSFERVTGENALIGVVDGLVVGENLMRARVSNPRGDGAQVELVVTNHPGTGPIFSGPHQQPFVCTTWSNGLGQPIIDNQDAFGIPVAEEDADGNYPRDGRGYPTAAANIIGWSKDCSAQTRIDYLYRTTGGAFAPLDDPTGPLPDNIAMTTTLDGQTVPYIVRWERGTNNRFIYSIAMLAPTTDTDPWNNPDESLWNGRLVFSFQGGVAIGRTQGVTSSGAQLPHPLLSLGYAVVNSTGIRTNTHYNLQLGGETALMLKERFIVRHGVPDYTVGVGGSGGAIQQYVYGQNHPDLLDAAIPQYSYPDMVTQTIHVGDCELLEHYFDVTDGSNPKWLEMENRRAIMGLNTSREPKNLSAGAIAQWNGIYGLYALFGLPVPHRDDPAIPALTECRRAWFGLTPLALNPTFTNVQDIDKLAQGVDGVEWTHWGDAVNIYGADENGWARVPWDNVGVQYGLQALLDGVITPDEFLHLNASVGSWKHTSEIVPEGFPFVGAPAPPPVFDPWSRRNMNLSPDGGATPAGRAEGDLQAMHAAYNVGKVFDGNISIPIIDWRHYLEDELDMHHSHQSFAARQRIADRMGHHDNHLIWFTDARPFTQFDQTLEAFMVIDEWMANIKANPHLSAGENRPPDAVDRCFNTDGTEFARGDRVWDGILNENAPGACTQKFEIYSSSRIVSGGPIRGGVFKCQLQSIDAAIAKGVYGAWVPAAAEKARLEEIFPTGVCDYSLPDAGRP